MTAWASAAAEVGQVVSFVHPGLAWAAAATAALPVIVHLLNRRRYRRVPWAAMTFLLRATERSRRRLRLQTILLMAARILALVLLGLAIARPLVPGSYALGGRSQWAHRILVLDNSLAMNAHVKEGETRLDHARRTAEALLGSFPVHDPVSLVTLSEPAEAVIDQGVYERRTVRERLASVEPTRRPVDPVGAVEQVLSTLEHSGAAPGNRFVYVISDFRRITYEGERVAEDTAEARNDRGARSVPPTAAVSAMRKLAAALEDPASQFHLLLVPAEPSDNLAVTRLEATSLLLNVQQPVRVEAEVGNFGSQRLRGLTLQIRRDGTLVRRESLPELLPGERTSVGFSLAFASPGTHVVEARAISATGDALRDDDSRVLSLDLRPGVFVLLVDGRPGPSPLLGQAGFLATALAPRNLPTSVGPASLMRLAAPAQDPIVPRVITVPELAGEVLERYDVVALCNVARLREGQWSALQRFVEDGGGLLFFSGDQVAVEHYNTFGYADGQGVLPVQLLRATPGTGGDASPVALRPDGLTHPVVASFRDQPQSGLFLAQVARYLQVEVDPARGEVLMRYTNGDPAVVASASGRGRVLFYTTTAGMDWTNLPAKGDFVSLMVQSVSYLAPQRGARRNLLVGQTLREPLDPAQGALALRITDNAGQSQGGRIVPEGGKLMFEFGPLESPGALTLHLGGEELAFAVNVSSRESPLEACTPEKLRALLACGANVLAADSARLAPALKVKSTELASMALYAVVVLLLLETWLAMWFGLEPGRSRRADRHREVVERSVLTQA